jgi:DDE family transposase
MPPILAELGTKLTEGGVSTFALHGALFAPPLSWLSPQECQPCPVRTQCTTSRDGARNVGFPPRELRDLQLHVRAQQQTPDWRARYAVGSGVESTVNEFAHGHGMRRCRYRGLPKARLQHVFTAIAVTSNVSAAYHRSARPSRPGYRPPSRITRISMGFLD